MQKGLRAERVERLTPIFVGVVRAPVFEPVAVYVGGEGVCRRDIGLVTLSMSKTGLNGWTVNLRRLVSSHLPVLWPSLHRSLPAIWPRELSFVFKPWWTNSH
jgi:hypothetical protein